MAKKDYYESLGINKTATSDEIKSSFRKLAKKYHPDVNKSPDAETKFKEIQEAYAVLSDENRRHQYDQYGHDAFTNSGGNNYGDFDFSSFDFSDIFENIFGSNFGFSSSSSSSRRRATQGNDTLLKITLDFEEAAFGIKKDIIINLLDTCGECHGHGGHGENTCTECRGSGSISTEQRSLFGTFLTKTTCPKCEGTGKTYNKICSICNGRKRIKKDKKINVSIPSGINNGDRLRLSGQGEAGLNGGPNGNIYLEIKVLPHEFYERDNDDIYLEVPLTITEAILGTKKNIPTIYGIIKLTIPSGTNSGDKVRIKGKGINNESDYNLGDMYVIFNVKIPKKLSKEQKKIIDHLNKTNLEDSEINKFNRFTDKKNKK
ncbi:MAG: molecular chaperone DnaJ [Tenericutes bacterium]|jgi:molecular chaperone DnaJ|nr:molecular chaperone DnaJ [Mycoplasmatota bacterium]